MKKVLIVILSVFCLQTVIAQDKSVQEMRDEASRTIKKDPNDTIPKIWKIGGVLRFTMTQGYQENWAAGGEKNTLGLSSFLSAYAFYKKGKHSWDNTLDLGFGFLQTSSLGFRKSDDRIDLLSKYGYDIGKNWYISGLMNFRTQFAPGYAYPSQAGTQPVLTSDFLAPAYLIVSPGVNWMPNKDFSFFISPATLRWTFVKNDSLSAEGAFGVDTGKTVLLEFGAYSSITYSHKINPYVVFSSRLDLFSNYQHDPQDVDVNWINVLAVKVSGIITMTASFNLIYDNDIKTVQPNGSPGGAAAQIQELLGIGVQLKL
jgi:hypothetical protein